MTAKETALRQLESALQDYFTSSTQVRRFRKSMYEQGQGQTPCITILDNGGVIPEIFDGSQVRNLTTVGLHLLVRMDSPDDSFEKINDLVDGIQAFCEARTLVVSPVVDLTFRSADRVVYSNEESAGVTEVTLDLRYVRDWAGGPVVAGGSDLAAWGSLWIEPTRAAIKAVLEDLVVDMATGYSPAPVAVYDTHNKAAILRNSITIGLDEAGEEAGAFAVSPVGPVANHRMIFSIRCHTDFVGGFHDSIRQASLLESIENKLRKNLELTAASGLVSQIRIITVGPLTTAQTFEESGTLGGDLRIQVQAEVEHAQE